MTTRYASGFWISANELNNAIWGAGLQGANSCDGPARHLDVTYQLWQEQSQRHPISDRSTLAVMDALRQLHNVVARHKSTDPASFNAVVKAGNEALGKLTEIYQRQVAC